MKQIYPLTLGALLALPSLTASAQSSDHRPCGSDEAFRRAVTNDPGILQRQGDLERFTEEYTTTHRNDRADEDPVYVIPLVFHILYNDADIPSAGATAYGSGLNANISDEQIYDAVSILNRDYRKLNPDTLDIVFGFDTIAADVKLEFRLATINPYGNCTNGIDRIKTTETFVGDDGSKLNYWFRFRYMNIWVVADMDDGVAGYAYYPSAVGSGFMTLADGVIIRHDYIGSIGTSSIGHSRALTHEIGHTLNLQHPWGSTNDPGVECGDDGVMDTPITKGWNFCPAPMNSDVCEPGVYENYQNYMDYSYCSVMFTNGQKDRMRATLNNTTASRSNLWQPENLALAGVDGVTDMMCTPDPDLYAEDRYVCQGAPVTFHDNTHKATATNWLWEFPDGSPSTATDQNPTVSFNSPGWKSVTLTAGNTQGAATRTVHKAIFVGAPYPESYGTFNEPFDAEPDDDSWFVDNLDENQTAWTWTNAAGHGATGCMKLNTSEHQSLLDFIDTGDNDLDVLVSPLLDLSNVSGIQLSFWYAYSVQSTQADDLGETLRIYTSTDCGKTWVLRTTMDAFDLITAGIAQGGFTPASSEWAQKTLNLPSSTASDDLRFKFVYISSNASGDLYLDDIQISGVVGISDQTNEASLTLAPNPSSGEVTISWELAASSGVDLSVLDTQGRSVWTRSFPVSDQGSFTLGQDRGHLAPGVYLVRLDHKSGSRTERLVIR
ncbi:MAG: PKD domain-containing protein [Flavobacteriales bacterium]|nr:PKD domain-containing protein [Flavobacteriales bacterium]MCB9168051.1 PKD domain-containing protein [Flavobacteriales bacterium]